MINMAGVTIPERIGFVDGETLALPIGSQVWETGFLLVKRGEVVKRQLWTVRGEDLDLTVADEESLKVNRFHYRHPAGKHYVPGNRPAPVLCTERDMYTGLADLTGGKLEVLGCNPLYDYTRIEARGARFGVKFAWHYHPDDLASMAKGYLDALRRPYPNPCKSDTLSLAIGVDPADFNRHTALGDCDWGYAWWRRMKGLSS